MKQYIHARNGFKTLEEEEFPNIVNVCVLKGACPCKCKHCPVGMMSYADRKKNLGDESMSFSTFKKVADEIILHKNSSIRIHSVGEPLLWTHLKKALNYTRDNNIMTWIFTSLVTNDEQLLTCIANCNAIVEVSINSIDAKNYAQTKGLDSYDKIIKNLEYVSNTIKKSNSKTRLIVSRVQSADKEYDEKFVNYWKSSGIVADAFIRSFHDYNGIIKSDIASKRSAVPCMVHWARFSIDCNGNAVVCFNELFKKYDDSLVLGNVNTISIKEMWHGDKLNTIREAQMVGDYGLIDFTKHLPCKDCKFCQPLDTKRTTSEYQLKQVLTNNITNKINKR